MFNRKKESDVDSLVLKSHNIISVFEKTKEDLLFVNYEILDSQASRKIEIARLQQEDNILIELAQRNTKVASKIDEFLKS